MDEHHEDVWSAYARAEIDLTLPDGCRVTFTPAPAGTTVGAWPLDAGETMHVVTAWNPGSRPLPAAENARRQAALRAVLAQREIEWLPAVGRAPDGTWQEESMGIRHLPLADAVVLGRRFGQRAIYALSAGGLAVVGCAERHEVRLGWRLAVTP
jgi:hypothetical protein